MKITCSKLLWMFLFVLVAFPRVIVGQAEPQVFALPDARVGEPYQVELEKVLREKYRLRLESDTKNAIVQWALAGGKLPAGMSVRPDGFILGTTRASSEESYNIRLKVIDVSMHSDELLLDFTLTVKPTALRLIQITGPRLMPIEEIATRSAPSTSMPPVTGEPGAPPAQTPYNGAAPQTPAPTATPSGKPPETADPKNTSPLSSKYMRAIVGIEQSGVSSGASAQNPFVDFFFNAGLTSKHLFAWGDVRLTSTPQQLTAFVSAATNTPGAATGGKINDLATSFDFKFGPEYALNEAKVRTSLIAGFGSASVLSTPSSTGSIFKLPSQASSQFNSFINQYPEAKTPGAAYISFVPFDRDRFFRQYFMGVRIRSYHEDEFPSMLDVTFGQNSAVTGGQLRHFVLGIEGSHRLSLMDNAFYIFGSVNLKAGGPKYSGTPFILDPAETTVKLSDPTVVITSRQFNRDFYRIGFGVDLMGLFKKQP